MGKQRSVDISKDPVAVFTHDDLDGGGVAALAEHVFKDRLHELRCLNYHNIDAEVTDYVHWNYKSPQILVVADICPSQNVTNMLVRYMEGKQDKLVILDHHRTTLWLNDYGDPDILNDESRCGALLFHNWLRGQDLLGDTDGSLEFAQSVDAYDRWLLKSPFCGRGEKLNRLWWFLGKEMFVRAFAENWNAETTPEHQYIDDCLLDQEERAVRKAVSELITDENTFLDREKRSFLLIPVGKYSSQIGNAILEEDNEIDYVVMLNATYGSLSFRARKGGVDVSEIAKRLGGGGHPAAAGCELPVMEALKVFIAGLF